MAVKIPEFDPIEFLVDRKFPRIKAMRWARALDAASLLPVTQDLLDAADAYELEVRELPANELGVLVEAERIKAREEEEQARFFNAPTAHADFEHWSKQAYWTIDEAVALSLGRDPTIVNLKKVEPEAWRSPFARRYVDLHGTAMRAVWAGQLFERCYPTIFLAWAGRLGIDVAEGLVAAVEVLGQPIADWKTLYDDLKKHSDALLEKQKAGYVQLLEDQRVSFSTLLGQEREQFAELHSQDTAALADLRARIEAQDNPSSGRDLVPREKESLLKLVIGMAVSAYRFDPKATRSKVTTEITSDLERAGVALDADTVRKWLHEAAEFLPSEAE